jgi:NAD(P)-dependent dehydrogenase (short-subunit alcohol dehydrogenase family)
LTESFAAAIFDDEPAVVKAARKDCPMNATELFDLTGKVAVITGGAGSIGLAYGRALGEAGASVVLADVDEGAATKAAEAVKADGFAAVGVAVDVRDLASAQAMARTAIDAFGGIDILVNNAAIMRDLPQYGLSNMPVDEWDRVMDVNLHSLTANLASELGPQGINVNAIAPGLVAAESGYASLPADSPIRTALEATIPGKKSGPPEDLVGTLLLLCSSAGDWINGQTISVDGGWVMRL